MNKAYEMDFDYVNYHKGISIGCFTSQIFAIYYLNDLDHYIKEKLKIKHYIRYMDDFILIHSDKEYLKECLIKIKKFLIKYKLNLNNKTMISKNRRRIYKKIEKIKNKRLFSIFKSISKLSRFL